MANARISLPSDRSFDTYEGALARVRGAKLPDATQVYYNQGFLDLELSFPIRSQDSPFSMRVLFGRGLAQPDGDLHQFHSSRRRASARSGFTTTRRSCGSIRKRTRRRGCS